MIGVAPPGYDPAAPESATTLPVGTPITGPMCVSCCGGIGPRSPC